MRQPGRRPPRGSADDAAGAAILSTGAGLLISLALLVRETPYPLTAFTFLGQFLLLLGMVLLLVDVAAELRRRGGAWPKHPGDLK
jgi:hypothetical protein